MNIRQAIAAELKFCREEPKLWNDTDARYMTTLDEVAEACKCSRTRIAEMEAGKRLTVENIAAYCEAIHMPLGEFFDSVEARMHAPGEK